MANQPDFIDLLQDANNQKTPENANNFVDLLADAPAKQNLWDKLKSIAIASRIPAAGLGVAQGVGDMGASLANIPLGIASGISGHDVMVPHPDLHKYVDPSTASQLAFYGGEGASYLLPAKGASGLAAAINPGRSVPYLRHLLGAPLEGAAIGGLLGEDADHSRSGSALLGSALAGAGALYNGVKSIRPKAIVDDVLEGRNNAISQYSHDYNQTLTDPSLLDVKGNFMPVKLPSISPDDYFNSAPKRFKSAYEDFVNDPTPMNAHQAQSDLGKYINMMEKRNVTTKPELDAIDNAKDLQEHIRNNLKDALNADPTLGLADKYAQLTQGYGQDVIPYTKNKALNDYRRGDISEETLVNKLVKNYKFRSTVGEDHTNLQNRELVDKILKNKYAQWGFRGAAATLGGKGILDFYNKLKEPD